MMRPITCELIKNTIAQLAQKANFSLRADVRGALQSAYTRERDTRARKILAAIIENARIASKEKLAICQDTGLAVVFAEVGQEVHISGGSFTKAINEGIHLGYQKGYLRASVIGDPIFRGKPDFSPVIIHSEIVPGSKLRLTVLPKGFGCENKGQVKMFNPTVEIDEIKKFIIAVVKNAGPDACPPYVVGVGIGGTQDYACLLAKKALLRKIVPRPSSLVHRIWRIEQSLLKEINCLNIGPMGLGGRITCLGVTITTYPTHIAGLPVAVNISCHALRSAVKIL
jgi:fumarate hydratase subunit alpha